MSRIQTQIFYIIIIAISSFFAFKSQIEIDEKGEKKIKFRKIFFLLSFLISWFIISFTNIGSDYENYYYIIDRLTWSNYNIFSSEEPGMNLVFLIIREIVHNTDVTIFIIKTITIAIIFYTFYIIKEKLKVGYAVLSYLLLVYLSSFYLITISLAASIVYLAIDLKVYKDKKILPIILILIAAQLHNSAYIVLPMYMMILIFYNNKQVKLKKILICIIYIITILLSGFIFNYFSTSVKGFHYNNYGTNDFSGTGIMVIFMYLPLLLLYCYIKKYNKNEKMNSAFFVLALTSCMFKILSYRFRVIERMEYYILPLFSNIIPTIIFENNLDKVKDNKKLTVTRIFLFFILYLLFRGSLVFFERTTSISGVGIYNFFNPFVG